MPVSTFKSHPIAGSTRLRFALLLPQRGGCGVVCGLGGQVRLGRVCRPQHMARLPQLPRKQGVAGVQHPVGTKGAEGQVRVLGRLDARLRVRGGAQGEGGQL